jgi:hypothetical protein
MTNDNPIDWDAVIDRLKAGWRKKAFGYTEQATGGVCLVGAVAYVHQTGSCEEAEWLVKESPAPTVVHEHFPERSWDYAGADAVEMFNDHPDTTLDDVILVCEKARGSSWA